MNRYLKSVLVSSSSSSSVIVVSSWSLLDNIHPSCFRHSNHSSHSHHHYCQYQSSLEPDELVDPLLSLSLSLPITIIFASIWRANCEWIIVICLQGMLIIKSISVDLNKSDNWVYNSRRFYFCICTPISNSISKSQLDILLNTLPVCDYLCLVRFHHETKFLKFSKVRDFSNII